MAKVKNVSGEARTVPALDGRLVLPGAEVDVPEGYTVEQFTDQVDNWALVKTNKAKG